MKTKRFIICMAVVAGLIGCCGAGRALAQCDTVRTLPWEEPFAGYAEAAYNSCWTLGGWVHLQSGQSSYLISEETNTYLRYDDLLRSGSAGSGLVSPPIALPADGMANRSLWLQAARSIRVLLSPTGADSAAAFTDTLLTTGSAYVMAWHVASLARYAGQTVRLKFVSTGGSATYINTVRIDYDTLPLVTAEAPAHALALAPTQLTARLRRGSADGLRYRWTSALGGTLTTNTRGDSATITYTAAGTDTLRCVATNAYGSDTTTVALRVVDCTPATTLPWHEDFDDGITCWYKPEGSLWAGNATPGLTNDYTPYYLYTTSGSANRRSWIMSKAIELPADTAARLRLCWDMASQYASYAHRYGVYITDSADYTDTANYTLLHADSTTLPLYPAYDTLSAPVAAWAGRTVHVAFAHQSRTESYFTARLYVDNVEIRDTRHPRVEMASDGDRYYYGDTATFVARLLEGEADGLTYAWHSSLLDTTFIALADTLRLGYGTAGGTDTVTVTATNAYGQGSATAVVQSVVITQPEVSLGAEGKAMYLNEDNAEVGDTVTYVATRNRCVTTGMAYRLHSSLQDTTLTVATGADTCRFALAYTRPGADTVTVSLVNTYAADSARAMMHVYHCPAAGVPFVATFDDSTSLGCWQGYWTRVHRGNGNYMVQYPGNRIHDGLITPAIDLPTDSVGLQVSWYTYKSYTSSIPVTIAVSPTGSARIADFTDTLFDGYVANGTYDTASLDAYRGMRVRLVFYGGYSNFFDDIAVDYNTSEPRVVLQGPATTYTGGTTRYTARLTQGSPRRLAYSWHSTMADLGMATLHANADTLYISHIVGGTDTLRCVVSNAFGADTQTVVVNVKGCAVLPLPYSEDFESTPAVAGAWDEGQMPQCWDTQWGGNAAWAPKVMTHNEGYDQSPNGSRMLILSAAYSSMPTLANTSCAVLPALDDDIRNLKLSLLYAYSNSSMGSLSVGYILNGAYVQIKRLPAATGTGRRDTISFASAPAGASRIAIRYQQASGYYQRGSAYIDDVAVTTLVQPHDGVTVSDSTGRTAVVRLVGASTAVPYDTAHFAARVVQGSDTGLVYNWFSTMETRGAARTVEQDSLFHVVYHAAGIDTVGFSIGGDSSTAWMTVSVVGTPQIALVAPRHTPTGDPQALAVTLTGGTDHGLTYSWHSTMATAGNAMFAPAGAQAVIEYLAGGTDTITVNATGPFGNATATTTVKVDDCRIATFPAAEGFEGAGYNPEGDNCAYIYCQTVDDCWLQVNRSEGQGWERSQVYCHSGSWAMHGRYATSGDPTDDWLVSPAIEVPDSGRLVMKYRLFETSRTPSHRIQLRVSTNGRADTAFFADTLAADPAGIVDYFWREYSVSLGAYRGQAVNVAFRNLLTARNNSSVVSDEGIMIDDIEFILDQVPVVSLKADAECWTCDTAMATLGLNRFGNLAYTIRWHSALADRGLATLMPQGDTLRIVYHGGGRDTLSVAASNAFGTDSAWCTSLVNNCATIQQLPYTTALRYDDDQWACWRRWATGSNPFNNGEWGRGIDYYHHTNSYPCIISKYYYNYNDTTWPDAWIASPLVHLPAGATSITLRWNGFVQDGTYEVRLSATGRGGSDRYTDLLYSETCGSLYTPRAQNHWSTHTASLTRYAGQVVSIAFHLTGPLPGAYSQSTAAIDTVWIECSYVHVPDTVWRTLTVASADPTLGTASGSGVYADSSLVVITATPAQPATGRERILFDHWNDGLTDNPRTVLLTSDTAFTAHFRVESDSMGLAAVQQPAPRIYPNPASSALTVECTAATTATLLTTEGREALRLDLHPGLNSVDVSTLPAGVYYLVGGGAHTKLVIAR